MRKLLGLWILLAAMSLHAADVSGKWSGTFTVKAPDGEKEETAYMVLQQKGAELTGTAGPDESRQWPIQKGKIDGDKITFEVQADGPLFKLEVVIDGDHLKGNITGTNGDGETLTAKLDLTRAK